MTMFTTKMADKYLVVRRDGTIPKWPAFVLGARDPAAATALRAYAEAAKKLGMDPGYIRLVLDTADIFDRYREEEGGGDPDITTPRTDDWSVLEALKGEPTAISVNTDQFNAAKGFDANVRRRL